MSQENILDYLRRTPHNTNVNVVKGMISGVGGSLPEVTEADDGKVLTVVDGQWSKAEGGGDKGYECTETKTVLTEESVTTTDEGDGIVADLSYSQPLDADIIRVTFNGTEYTCEKSSMGPVIEYGAPWSDELGSHDFSTYPFSISSVVISGSRVNSVFTETAGTYSVKIETVESSVETTECFKKAVESVVGASPSEKSLAVHLANDTFDTTADEIVAAIMQGTTVFVYAQYGEFGGQVLSYNYEDRQNQYSFYLINGATIVRYSGIGGNSFPSLQS